MKKTPQELGYTIPVLFQIEQGRYKTAFAKTLKPNRAGCISVRYKSGKASQWQKSKTLTESEVNETYWTKLNG